MILHYVTTVHVLKKKIFDDRLYFGMLIMTVAAGTAIGALYGGVALRYAVSFAVIALLAFFWRRDIGMFFAMLKAKRSGS